MSDLKTFTAAIDRFQERLAEKSRLVVQGVAVTLSNEIVSGGRYSRGTPVDTAFAQNSWQGSTEGVPAGASGNGSPEQVEAAALSVVPGQTFGLANNAPYIRRLEFGFVGPDALGRVYDQAGRAFVRDALDNFQLIVNEVAEHVAGRE